MEMTENKIFSYALAVSLIIHAAVFIRFSFNHPRLLKETIRPLELTYQPIKVVSHKPEPKVKPPSVDSRMASSKIPLENRIQNGPPLIKVETNSLPAARLPLPVRQAGARQGRQDELSLPPSQWQMDKSRSVRIDTWPVERKISVPELKSEKINNPVYLDYYQIVRNRIKDRAYRNYARMDAGEVYLTFVLASNGSLKQIKLIDEKTSAGAYLRDIGLKSIRESSPFPSFPHNLAYPELSFNVIISFEVKN